MPEWLSLALMLGLTGQPVSTPAEDEAQIVAEAIEDATELASRGQHAAALDVVTRARQRFDDPRLTYMEAQLLRLTGDCDTAVERYREFLGTEPDAVDRQYALESIEECGGDPNPPAESEPSIPEPKLEPDVPPPSAVELEPVPANLGPAPRSRDPRPTSLGLLISGGAGIVVGGVLLGAGFGVRAAAIDGGLTLEDYQGRERTAGGLGVSGVVVMSMGAALLTAGVIHALVSKRRRTQDRVASW